MDYLRTFSLSNITHEHSLGGKDPFQLAEEKFQHMIAEVEDYAILILSPDGKIVSWNKGVEKIKGYSQGEILGKNFKIFYPKEDVDREIPDMLLKHARENGRASHEGWRIKKDGTRFWGSVVITALHDETGNITGFLKVTRDLSEKKIIEDKHNNYLEELRQKNEELKKSEGRYHKMVSEIKDYSIILLDVTGKILDWNQGAEKLNGYKAEEILGKNFRLFYPAEDKINNLPEKLLEEASEVGSVINEGYRIKKDGSRFWAYVVITALHDDSRIHEGYKRSHREKNC
jgi:PAS domain S-box-containing protein